MNWAAMIVAAGLVFFGAYTLPYGAVVLLALGWLWRRS